MSKYRGPYEDNFNLVKYMIDEWTMKHLCDVSIFKTYNLLIFRKLHFQTNKFTFEVLYNIKCHCKKLFQLFLINPLDKNMIVAMMSIPFNIMIHTVVVYRYNVSWA